jgi:hypothetical protein
MAPNGLESLARLQEVRVDRAEAKKTARWRDGGMEKFLQAFEIPQNGDRNFQADGGRRACA